MTILEISLLILVAILTCAAIAIFFLSRCRNTTQRKQADEALRESEENYRNLIERANDAICIIQDSLIKYTNSRQAEIWGGNVEELIDTPFINYVHPDDVPLVTERYNLRMAGEQVPQVYELSLKRKDGSRIYTEVSIGMANYKGKPAELVIIRDISERKQAEAKLQELYNEEARLRLELENEIKGRISFTSALVHELKTPLTPLLTSSDMLVAQLKEEPFLSMARNINRGAINLNSQIDELLDLARSEMGVLTLKFHKTDVLQLLRDVVDEITSTATQRRQTLELNLPDSLPFMQVDANRLRQIVTNLLNNASKFTPEEGKITVTAKEKASSLVIEIQDTGPGIAREKQERLFEPYYHTESAKQNLSGLGLRLALCKILVELHGGQIWVRSNIGEGSVFGFSIPIQTGDIR